jgi:hypothetical protein
VHVLYDEDIASHIAPEPCVLRAIDPPGEGQRAEACDERR